jgi:hypothetical protein
MIPWPILTIFGFAKIGPKRVLMRSQREGAKGSERERERERDENEIKREVKTLTIAKLRIWIVHS